MLLGAPSAPLRLHAGLPRCCSFQASIPGLWWYRGKIHRNMLSPGFRLQQSGEQSQVIRPAASLAR